jgi:hypothetical protein
MIKRGPDLQTKCVPLLRSAQAPDGRWTVHPWAPVEGFVLIGGWASVLVVPSGMVV